MAIAIVLASPLWGDGRGAAQPSDKQVKQWMNTGPVEFIENKGQLADSSGIPLNKVLFRAELPGTVLYVTEWGLTYYFYKTDRPVKDNSTASAKTAGKLIAPQPQKIHWQRVDMELLGANIRKTNIEKDRPVQGFFNYYYAHCPDGILNVRAYRHILIKDIYPGIDWEIVADGRSKQGFKTNYIVAPGADYKQIRMKIWGPEGMLIAASGNELNIATAFGKLTEAAPVAYTETEHLEVAYTQSDEYIGFELPSYNTSEALIIDPMQLIWATYYGGSGTDYGRSIHSDGIDVWVTGYTVSPNFPTLDPGGGAYFQGTYGGGSYDAFILQFNTSGVRQWATYYGGAFSDEGNGITVSCNAVWIAGDTYS
ncbi:MAG: hypothetical protein ACE5DN_04345, partial [Flavobacteriales bacterium]